MNFTSKNSRFGVIRENEPPKKRDNRFKRDNSMSRSGRSRNDKLPEPKVADPPPLTKDYYPTLGESVSNETSQETASLDGVPKQETTWKDLIAKSEDEETEEQLEDIQPGWIRLRMDKKTHKIIREYGPPVKDSGWFSRWQDHERMMKQRRWLAYMEEQEEIRREMDPDYLYRRDELFDDEYESDDEDIIVVEDCSSDEPDEYY